MLADHAQNCRMTRRSLVNAGLAALATAATALPQNSAAPKQTTDDPPFQIPTEPANAPLGTGKGIHPGRVSWVHDPKAALWDGKEGNWWEDVATDPRRVEPMLSAALQSLTGDRTDAQCWKSLFQSFNEAHKLSSAGYRSGNRIAIKLNSNQDRPGSWRFGAGMPSPQMVYALVNQLITIAGVPGQDITLYDASRYVGDPMFDRIKANRDRNFQAVNFVASQRMAGRGRTAAVPDKTKPIKFSKAGVPDAYLPDCVTGAKYVLNISLARAHGLMGITATAKNQFGSVYFEGAGFTPQPLHDFASRDLPMGSYNCLVDLIANKNLGGKTFLYLIDFLYVAESQNVKVIKYKSFDDQWCSSMFASQDPVAIDSVALDFIRNEPSATECRGKPENYLHEAALAEKAPSGITYNSQSLGVHEHWNNAIDRKYSRNLGKRQGIELVKA